LIDLEDDMKLAQFNVNMMGRVELRSQAIEDKIIWSSSTLELNQKK